MYMLLFITALLFIGTSAQDCKDLDNDCYENKGYCSHPGKLGEFMRKHCRKTCGFCRRTTVKPIPPGDCVDHDWTCPSNKIYCKHPGKLGDFMKRRCPLTCGYCKKPTLKPGITIGPHIGGCGRPDIKGITRIIAGKTAVRGSWPWQVLVTYDDRPVCGGTLINPQWVVTAAHCVYEKEESGLFKIRIGEHDREHLEGSEVDIKVVNVFRHENFQPHHLNNDIAMFKLEKPIKFNKYVSAACLPKSNIPVGSKCIITGWGKIHHPGTMTRFLQQGILPVVSNKVCEKKNQGVIPDIQITDAMVCAGSGGTKPLSGCHGDSGGPLVCKVNGVWELHGDVSFGSPECKSDDMYTVFARTFHFLEWIKGKISKH